MQNKDEQAKLDNEFFNTLKLDAMKTAFANGANINAKMVDVGWLTGRTMVHQIVDLCFSNQCSYDPTLDAQGFEMLDWLLTNGADINAREKVGFTPLQLAIYRGKSLFLIEYLCSKNANPNNKSDSGLINNCSQTVLRTAMSSTYLPYIECLCENGAIFNDDDFKTFMKVGVMNENVREKEIKEFLLAQLQKSPMCFLTLNNETIKEMNQFLGENAFQNLALKLHDQYMDWQNQNDLKLSMILLLLDNCDPDHFLYRFNLGALVKLQNNEKPIGFFTSNLLENYAEMGLQNVIKDLEIFYINLMGQEPNLYVSSCINGIVSNLGVFAGRCEISQNTLLTPYQSRL